MELKSTLDKVPPKKLIGAGTGVLVLGVILGWFGFPALLHSQMASNLVLKKGGMARQIWEKVPFPINFKVYIFNVTNPMEVHKGAKPVVNEIGPYWYDEYKEKVNLQDRNKDDTVSFNMKDRFYFNKEKSGRLTGDEMLTVPHFLLVGIVLAVEHQKPAGLKLVSKALPHIFNKPETIFITARARDLMWDGVPVDCSSTDFAAKAVCAELRKKENMFKKVDEDNFLFSYLGPKNSSVSGQFRVKRGMQNISDLGRVVEFEGEPQLSNWDGDECNKFQGTDSTIFPPFREITDIIAVFVPDICRSLPADYEEPDTYRGLSADMYSAEFGDMSSDPHLACFCTTPTTCLKKGVHDITRCTGGVPIITSLPHFFAADVEYQTGVVGLRPNKKDHGSYFKFQRFTGVPVTGFKRLQFALPLHAIDKVDLMVDLPTVMHPVFWVEESLELEGDLLAQLKLVFTVLDVLEGLKWFMITAGGAMGVGGAILHFKKRTGSATMNKHPPAFHRKITTGVAPLEAKSPQRY